MQVIIKYGTYTAWLAERVVSADWWRCDGCLTRQKVDSSGWECQYCKRECEPDRIDSRLRIQNERPKASRVLSDTDIENWDADNYSEYLDRYSDFDAPPSALSYEDYQQGMEIADSEGLVSLLWPEQELQDLFREGTQKTDSERCERHLRLALLRYSAQLRTQASTSDERRAAQIMKSLAIEIAYLFRLRMDLQTKRIVHEGSKAKGGIQALAEDVLDEENMGEEEEFQELQTGMSKKDIGHQKLENFVLDSNALAVLKDSFRLFVHPNPVREVMLEIWPFSSPRNTPQLISCHMEWEIPKFLKNFFPFGQRLGDILTITSEVRPNKEGDLLNAQATSCRDYLTLNWPTLGPFLLEGLERFIATSNPGETTVILSIFN